MRFPIAVMLCLFSFKLVGQTPYAKVIQHPGNPLYGRTHEADVANDGRIVTLGRTELGMALAVYSDSATLLWSERFSPASVNMTFNPLQVRWMANGDILVTGYVQLLPSGRNIGLMRLDPSGVVLWSKMFRISGDMYTDGLSRALPLANDEIAVLSFTYTRLTLSRFDSQGQFLWSKSYPQLPFDHHTLVDLQEFPNGDLFIRDVMSVLRIDNSGTVIYSYNYDIPGTVIQTPQVYFPRATLLSDGGFILQSLVDYYPSLIRCDSAGTIQWAKTYDHGDYYQPWFTRMVELPDSTILAFPTSGWNTTIGLHIDPSGGPLARLGVEGNFRLWPGSSSYWPQPYIGVWNGYYHFLGTIQQVVNGGFTPELTALFRLDDDLLTPCASLVDNFLAADIDSLPTPYPTAFTQIETCDVWAFAYDLDSTFYSTTDACPLILSLKEEEDPGSLSVFPTVITAGETVAISIDAALTATRWLVMDMSGRMVDQGTLASAMGGPITLSSTCSRGLYSLVVMNGRNTVIGRARLLVH